MFRPVRGHSQAHKNKKTHIEAVVMFLRNIASRYQLCLRVYSRHWNFNFSTITEMFNSALSNSVKLQCRQGSDYAVCVQSYVVANCKILLLLLHVFKQHGFCLIQLSRTAVILQHHCLHAPVLNTDAACSHGFILCFPWFQEGSLGYYHFLPNTFQIISHSTVSAV